MTRLGTYRAAARQDRGAALVTVLLLVAVMAAGAAITFDALGYTIKRTTAQRMFNQARFYALGAEQLAVVAAERINKAKLRLVEPQAVSYPVEGGRIDGVIEDASNCFNINSLVSYGDGSQLRAVPETMLHYSRLLVHMGLPERDARQLTATLVDWLDSDSRPISLGAEDYDYAGLSSPYRAANTLMVDKSELAMVLGYAPEVRQVLAPLLCLMDDTDPVVMNVNTLRPQHAPLLAALVGEALDLAKAADVIASRPADGYQEIGDFWLAPGLRDLQVGQAVRAQTDVKASRFRSRIRVTYHDAVSRLTSVVHVDDSGEGRLVSHQFGVVQ
jgi:general secretion pathway protein K